jgi:hypothetical protein
MATMWRVLHALGAAEAAGRDALVALLGAELELSNVKIVNVGGMTVGPGGRRVSNSLSTRIKKTSDAIRGPAGLSRLPLDRDANQLDDRSRR